MRPPDHTALVWLGWPAPLAPRAEGVRFGPLVNGAARWLGCGRLDLIVTAFLGLRFAPRRHTGSGGGQTMNRSWVAKSHANAPSSP